MKALSFISECSGKGNLLLFRSHLRASFPLRKGQMQDTTDDVWRNIRTGQAVFARVTFWMGSGDGGQAVVISQPHWAFPAWSLALKNSSEPWMHGIQMQAMIWCLSKSAWDWGTHWKSNSSHFYTGLHCACCLSQVHHVKIDPLIALENTELCSMLAILLWNRRFWQWSKSMSAAWNV